MSPLDARPAHSTPGPQGAPQRERRAPWRSTWVWAWRYWWSRPLNATLNVLLLALGLGSVSFLLLVGQQLSHAFERDLAGVDAVVGAKGSPMQLILSGVLHVDVPPGNVPWKAVQTLAEHPMVAQVVPISLGDNLQSFRIVGTQPSYLQLYGAALAQGRLWQAPMEVVLGAAAAQRLGLALGAQFRGSHGLAGGGGGAMHGEHPYTVVGILRPQGGVLDRLILTDMASVWTVHEDMNAQDDEDRAVLEEEREVTMALVRYKTPMAALSFPRYVNTSTEMQAAAPALEITRLLSMLGVGTGVLRAFAAVLLLTAGLSVFIALWSAVREHRGELALLRMLGAGAPRLASLLLCEAVWLALVASVCGVLLGQGSLWLLAQMLQLDNTLLLGGSSWSALLWAVPGLALAISLAAALLPTWAAYRVSVLELLQSP